MKQFMEEVYQELNNLMHQIEDAKYGEDEQVKLETMVQVAQDLQELYKKVMKYTIWGIK